jgi:predicted tellurium resistance membrane protein TerC
MRLDIVFSLDSVITAVGMANEFWEPSLLLS